MEQTIDIHTPRRREHEWSRHLMGKHRQHTSVKAHSPCFLPTFMSNADVREPASDMHIRNKVMVVTRSDFRLVLFDAKERPMTEGCERTRLR